MFKKQLLTGAEACVRILEKYNIQYAFAYPGTSELLLCNELIKSKKITIINGRGDKESAFMSAGASMLSPLKAVAILHGARGLTNATGAIADTYRNEYATVFFVGLPSTHSAPYLPPHGEKDLIKNIGKFVKSAHEVRLSPKENDSSVDRGKKIQAFLNILTDALNDACTLPYAPTICGISQDCLELKWIPENFNSLIKNKVIKNTNTKSIQQTINIIKKSKKSLLLVDDFLFHHPLAKKSLLKLSNNLQSPILQINYQRGPMFFERICSKQNPFFVGPYNTEADLHKKLLNEADLLIMIEDRNGYKRIIGLLPKCKKISITSNLEMTKKNKTLSTNDILIQGNVIEIMDNISNIIKNKKNTEIKKQCRSIRKEVYTIPPIPKKYIFMRKTIPKIIAASIKGEKHPIIVDDSQMFGGLLAEMYEEYPSNLKVFGDHGAFVGAGIAYANGLALSSNNCSIICILGDQAFTNGFQGLVSSVENNINITYLVCNNQCSVSLKKQAAFQKMNQIVTDTFLENAPIHYCDIAKSIGLKSFKFKVPITTNSSIIKKSDMKLRHIIKQAITIKGPALIELIMPSTPEAWDGIWSTRGNENN